MSSKHNRKTIMPDEVSEKVGFFDRFAGGAAQLASRAPFFAFCLLLVFLWLAQGIVIVLASGDIKKFTTPEYQLEINTTTTIVTFLLVALLQNSATRSDQATQHKLNAIADSLADLMSHLAERNDDAELQKDLEELRSAVGLEEREGTADNAKDRSSSKEPDKAAAG